MAAGENRFAPGFNEKKVIELLEDLSNILRAFLIKQLFHSWFDSVALLSPFLVFLLFSVLRLITYLFIHYYCYYYF